MLNHFNENAFQDSFLHKELHGMIIDLEKAYDKVPWEGLYWSLRENFPEKYISIVQDMHKES